MWTRESDILQDFSNPRNGSAPPDRVRLQSHSSAPRPLISDSPRSVSNQRQVEVTPDRKRRAEAEKETRCPPVLLVLVCPTWNLGRERVPPTRPRTSTSDLPVLTMSPAGGTLRRSNQIPTKLLCSESLFVGSRQSAVCDHDLTQATPQTLGQQADTLQDNWKRTHGMMSGTCKRVNFARRIWASELQEFSLHLR